MSVRALNDRSMLDFPLGGVHLIEASAGTGKTYSIANLYLRQILAGRAVGQVLVVTFTKAATDELRGRLRARLFEALALLERGGDSDDGFLALLLGELRTGDAVDLAVRRLRLAVRSMDEAAVFSIHGFCQRVLTEFAFESGQGFELEVLADDAELWRAAVQDWWRRTAYPLRPAEARLFDAAVGDLEGLRGRLAPLLRSPAPELLPAVASVNEVLDRLAPALLQLADIAAEWRNRREDLASALLGSKALKQAKGTPFRPDALRASLAELDAYFAPAPSVSAGESPGGAPAESPPPGFKVLDATVIRAHLKKGKIDPALEDPFFERCAEVNAVIAGIVSDLRVAASADAAAFARAQVRRVKADAGLLSYDDMLTHLRDALADADGSAATDGTDATRGTGAAALVRAVTARYPVAMIDEFQDTDPLQWEIFRRLYLDGAPEGGLLLIGDPKQAIYSFRGGDIFTYMSAQRSIAVAQRATLLTNWRSTPEVVRAVNAIFSNRRTDPFVFGDAIGFSPSTAADKRHTYLKDGRAEQPALTLWRLPLDDGDAPPAKDKAGQWARAAVADEIVRLLSGARRGQVRLVERTGKRGIKGERPLEPGDIAILVRTRREGAALRRLLATRGVAALSVERASVYESDEAEALERLLTAVLTPRDRRSTRAALAVPLFGLDYVAMASIAADDEAWAAFVDWLLALRAAWQRRGFMAMFQCLLWQPGPRGRTVSEGLADGLDAERRLTNLLHLGELLQQASREHAGLDALIGWFRLQRDARRGEGAAEELQLRLESDANLVQIVTVHSAKGLQYPVVFLPDLWNPRTTGANQPLAFHRDGPAGPQACLDIGSDDRDAHLLLAERERLAEDVRLAYVALTRAESAVYLVWGRAGSAKHGSDSGRSALAWLLHPHQDAASLLHRPPEAFGADGETPAELDGDLNALAEAARGSIAVTALPQSGLGLALPRAETGLEPTLARFQGRIARDWRITSFSALARNLAEHPRASAEAVDGTAVRVDDEPPVADLEAVAGLLGEPSTRTDAEVDAAIDADDHSGASTEAAAADPVLSFPAGSDVGTFLHLLLEHLDFGGDVRGQVMDLSARFAARFGLDHRRHAGAAALMMERTLQTPISEDGFRLADLPATHRLNELAFDLATDHADIGALNRLLEANAGFTLPALLADDFAGMVTGVIDLVFEHAGRFYVADYKSNRLGRRFDDYAPDSLALAMTAHRYDLQYLLYTLALHRYLSARLPDYDYDRHMGGVYYLFLRGMRPETGAQRGVWFTRPESGLITALDRDIFPWARGLPELEA